MNAAVTNQTRNDSRLTQFYRDRVVGLIMTQLTQGVTPQKLSLTIALGLTLGIFPILGATTSLCAIAGVALRLNQPVIQLVNWLASPLQLSLILIFVRMGEWVAGARRMNFSLSELFHKFHESPAKFLHEFGLTGLHGILAWLVIAPFLSGLIYLLLLPPLKKLAQLKK